MLRILRQSMPIFHQVTATASTLPTVSVQATSLPRVPSPSCTATPFLTRCFHLLHRLTPLVTTSIANQFTVPNVGYKSKVHLKKRCQSCFYVMRKGRLYVECKAKPRHKQMAKMNKKSLYRE